MNKLLKGFGLMLVLCLGVAAQTPTGNNTDEYKKGEMPLKDDSAKLICRAIDKGR